jgi:hypothetical protein
MREALFERFQPGGSTTGPARDRPTLTVPERNLEDVVGFGDLRHTLRAALSTCSISARHTHMCGVTILRTFLHHCKDIFEAFRPASV